ncbi:MAG: hypothetical protein ABJA82_00390 [Myxococcales bacterium]
MRNADGKGATSESANDSAAEGIRAGARIASQTTNDVRNRVTTWRKKLIREAQERPGRTAAIAVGAGYLLGGGLFSALTARLVGTGVRVAMRLALIPLVTQTVASLGVGLFSADQSESASGSDNLEEPGDVPHGRSETRNGRRHSAEQKETNS